MRGRRPAAWHDATVAAVQPETATARRILLDVPTWPGNDAGSHLDIRLTAEDGYQATRSYSVASSGEGTTVTLAVDELPDGEVSPFLVRQLEVGDALEVHGPLGAYFVWAPDASDRPVQLIAGGSGVVPLYAMAEAHARAGDPAEFRMLYSVRSPESVFFRSELEALGGVDVTWRWTRSGPPGSAAEVGRVTRDLLVRACLPPERRPRVYVCGPTAFVEAVADWLVELGHAPADVRTERFGGS